MVEDLLGSIVIHTVKMVAMLTGKLVVEVVLVAHQTTQQWLIILKAEMLALLRMKRDMVVQVSQALSRELLLTMEQGVVVVWMEAKSDQTLGRL
jgi:hypothetical protein